MVLKRTDIGFFALDGGGYFAHLDSTAATRAEQSVMGWLGTVTLEEFGCCNEEGELAGVCGAIGVSEALIGRFEPGWNHCC